LLTKFAYWKNLLTEFAYCIEKFAYDKTTLPARIKLKQREENTKKVNKSNTIPIEIPQPFEDTWSPCASSRGVKLLISKTCAFRRILKGADFIGAYLQAKVIGRHFVILE
jgi:hypothetical protein